MHVPPTYLNNGIVNQSTSLRVSSLTTYYIVILTYSLTRICSFDSFERGRYPVSRSRSRITCEAQADPRRRLTDLPQLLSFSPGSTLLYCTIRAPLPPSPFSPSFDLICFGGHCLRIGSYYRKPTMTVVSSITGSSCSHRFLLASNRTCTTASVSAPACRWHTAKSKTLKNQIR